MANIHLKASGNRGHINLSNINADFAKPKVELVPFAIRPDAELIQSYRYDKHIVADEGVTLPAYSTTAKVLKESEALSPEITIDTGSNKILIVERFLSIPEYSTTDIAKGRVEYTLGEAVYEVTKVTPKSMKAIADNKGYGNNDRLLATASSGRVLYRTTETAVSVNTTGTYGPYQTAQAPTINYNSISVASPQFRVRGSTSYFTNTFMNALADVRFQYAIDVYKAPATGVKVIGWEHDQLLCHCIECANSAGHTLT